MYDNFIEDELINKFEEFFCKDVWKKIKLFPFNKYFYIGITSINYRISVDEVIFTDSSLYRKTKIPGLIDNSSQTILS
jgi:hypothetical protein